MLDLDASPYGAFVWPAFAITALVFIGMIAGALAHARHWRARTEALRQTAEAAEAARRGGPAPDLGKDPAP
ncbi:MAG: heme exporter protein CcmD [Phenylobacterium sp.]|uniref:heme exporter protein CcmD n=1 Tax=Phenylobacterium sp. TaxID=1871053 RepID=UPI00272755D1|nr:heme exporter protein CcmD [Phenylobacterium sp.]MDO8902623.1 heme exporter protein CcmD [Phenylobacterium sp.]